MLIDLNFKSGKPAYVQIVDQVKHAAASGALRDGDQLPSIRELAERLRVNRNTIARAYGELEREGVVETMQGRGVFVTANGSPLTKRVRDGILAESIDAAVVQAHHFRVGNDQFLEMVKRRLDEFDRRRDKENSGR